VKAALMQVCSDWQKYGVEGHFKGDTPWMHYHHFFKDSVSRLVGATKEEVVVMNTLTVNLHLMMVSFYSPVGGRFKIIMEAGAFPSDQYAVESQVRFHGYDPTEAIVEVKPRAGSDILEVEDILEAIRREGSSVALVLFSGVNYYTGQYYPIDEITRAAHGVGALAGFDLAHAAGNLPLRLHDWGVDFAVWCTYKYINSGPGGPGGVFVHDRHAMNPVLPRFAGWWGHDEGERFQMKAGFKPMRGADGWQLSNAQVFSMAVHRASLKLFDKAGMDALRAKSLMLTGYMVFILDGIQEAGGDFRIITPREAAYRGCQVSVLTGSDGRRLHRHLTDGGVLCDWREPNVIRMAPVPMYNTFEDIWRLGRLWRQWLSIKG
jgi:kynureninase